VTVTSSPFPHGRSRHRRAAEAGDQAGAAGEAVGGRRGARAAGRRRTEAETAAEAEVDRLAEERGEVYRRVQSSPEFQEIRRRYRDFVFPMSGLFLLWYFAYVLASTLAHDFMAHRLVGEFNVALAFGLGQFLSTFVITWLYARNAQRKRDRAALHLRWDTQEMFNK
jgi:uncharacterized membrane protein (DUF485 family)